MKHGRYCEVPLMFFFLSSKERLGYGFCYRTQISLIDESTKSFYYACCINTILLYQHIESVQSRFCLMRDIFMGFSLLYIFIAHFILLNSFELVELKCLRCNECVYCRKGKSSSYFQLESYQMEFPENCALLA